MLNKLILAVLMVCAINIVSYGQNINTPANSNDDAKPPSTVDVNPPVTPANIETKTNDKYISGITEQEISSLIAKLSNDDPIVSSDTKNELIEIGKPAVLQLLDILEKTKPNTRHLICKILGSIRDDRAIPALVKLLENKEESLTSIASVAADNLKYFSDNSIIPYLMRVVTSTDINLRYESIKTLGVMRANQALPLIREYITDTSKTSLGYLVQTASIEAIGRMKDTQSISQLIALLKNTDIEPANEESVAKYVIKALERITNHQEGVFTRMDEKKKKQQVIKKWEDWWEKNKNNYE